MGDEGVDPGDGGAGEPGEGEEGDGEERATEHGAVEAMLRGKGAGSVGGFQMKELGGVDVFVGGD